MTRPTIEVFLKDNTWQADFSHADGAEEIKQLFDTYILPTAFTSKMSVTEVAESLARKNPGHEILVPF